MKRTPTGRLFGTDSGTDLVLDRTFRAPIEDVWASVTESERTARWFGPWEGDAGPGRTVKLRLAFEEQQPWCDLRIDACSPPRQLAVSMKDEAGNWRLELDLSEQDGVTTLRLTHHLDSDEGVGEVGPGWEYYLDMLVAAREGSSQPDFTEYYPEMKPYFEAQR
ncbi:SRPBCC family protein [Allokutzneria albata]|uniref:Uncharacterized conserved protein YndB, AHSA1/START domain n=1 Tax=Allokutzneria albata TaxID=211114 RepID=A0A1G9Y1H2_ALLAB|nr:SRPBCC family protein [Allokutzneria albata]SDN02293.1 Uncharacterized conserved protein YndB, AHSA1/START domain [Allokutzneria albata]